MRTMLPFLGVSSLAATFVSQAHWSAEPKKPSMPWIPEDKTTDQLGLGQPIIATSIVSEQGSRPWNSLIDSCAYPAIYPSSNFLQRWRDFYCLDLHSNNETYQTISFNSHPNPYFLDWIFSSRLVFRRRIYSLSPQLYMWKKKRFNDNFTPPHLPDKPFQITSLPIIPINWELYDYKSLRRLAKHFSIRANQKKTVLIEALNQIT